MSSLMLEPDQFVRSVEISKKDVFAVFLGAGASITSGIPSAGDCIWDWKRSLYLSQHPASGQKLDSKSDQSRTQIQKWLDSEAVYPAAGADEEYSFYIEKCYPIEDDRRKFFQRICERKLPSIGYKLLSLLHETGMVQSVWTTNFDDLGLHAARSANLLPIDITLDTVDRLLRPQNATELPYIKLHGDYKYGPLKNTTRELLAQDTTFRDRMVSYLTDKHLLVCGYSGRDLSVMQTLTEAYRRPGAGRLYWCGYGRDIPASVAALLETARASGREAFYIPTDGFDKLFISLASACTKDDDAYSGKFKQYLELSSTPEEMTPFVIPRTRLDTVIKSNCFQVSFPPEIFQFEYPFQSGEKPWATIRSLTAKEPITAVPFQKMVYALGTLSDINRVFSAGMKGKITRVPLSGFNLRKDTAMHSLLLSTITDLLARRANLPSDKKALIWKVEPVNRRKIGDTTYQIHAAIRLALDFDGHHYYLAFMPDFKLITDSPEKIPKEVFQEIGRGYFEKIWNQSFNEYLNDWRNLLLPDNGKVIDLEYPANSASGLIFKVDRVNAFAGLITQQPSNRTLSNNFNRSIIHHYGIQYPEPRLVFSPRAQAMPQNPTDFHPMRGVSSNRPYEFNALGGPLGRDAINLAVICPGSDGARFKRFLSGHLTSIDSKGINKAYLLPFPGFQQAFSMELRMPTPGLDDWMELTEPVSAATLQQTAGNLRNQIVDAINRLSRDGVHKILVLYIPNRWLPYTSYDLENEHYDLHDYVKAYCAERGIATQFINEHTLEDQLQCQINWWLSLSYYVKSLRTPWVLDSLDKDTAFAGVGYSVTRRQDRSEMVLGCSHIYNSRGQGLKYRLSKVEDQLFWDRQKNPHLSYNDSYKLGASIIDMFYRTMDEFPRRVVVHKRTYFTPDEIAGLRDSLLGNGIQNIDLIEVTHEDNWRYLASRLDASGMPDIDSFPLSRGTCIQLDRYEALLWTHGVVPSVENPLYKFYLGGRFIPGPLRIRKHFGRGDLATIATEILGLTKMNWNSFNLYSQLPATLNSSSEIARIGKLLTKKEGITYDYRYFI